MMNIKDVTIHTESITLDQFLKWIGITDTGGHAKVMIREGYVHVNKDLETRRSRVLYPGDVVCIQEHCFGVLRMEHE